MQISVRSFLEKFQQNHPIRLGCEDDTDRLTDRHTYRQTHIQTDRETDREADIHIDRQIDSLVTPQYLHVYFDKDIYNL